MRTLVSTVLLGSLTLAGAPAFAQATAASSPAPHAAAGIHIAGFHGKMMYRDAKGKPISADAFAQAVTRDGRGFSPKLSADQKTLTMSLLPKDDTGGKRFTRIGSPKLTVGKPLPSFTLPLIDGGKANDGALRGAPTLVDFFFADCIACIQELPAMNTYIAQHPKMHFLAITYDDAKTAKAFVSKHHFVWPVAYAGQSYVDRLNIRAYPTLLLLDANGRLLATHMGGIPIATMSIGAALGLSGTTATNDAKATNSQRAWLAHWVKQGLAPPSR